MSCGKVFLRWWGNCCRCLLLFLDSSSCWTGTGETNECNRFSAVLFENCEQFFPQFFFSKGITWSSYLQIHLLWAIFVTKVQLRPRIHDTGRISNGLKTSTAHVQTELGNTFALFTRNLLTVWISSLMSGFTICPCAEYHSTKCDRDRMWYWLLMMKFSLGKQIPRTKQASGYMQVRCCHCVLSRRVLARA